MFQLSREILFHWYWVHESCGWMNKFSLKEFWYFSNPVEPFQTKYYVSSVSLFLQLSVTYYSFRVQILNTFCQFSILCRFTWFSRECLCSSLVDFCMKDGVLKITTEQLTVLTWRYNSNFPCHPASHWHSYFLLKIESEPSSGQKVAGGRSAFTSNKPPQHQIDLKINKLFWEELKSLLCLNLSVCTMSCELIIIDIS